MEEVMPDKKEQKRGFKVGFEGILGGLGDLVEKLGELAEKGEKLSRSGQFQGKERDIKGVYGFSVKVGLGGEETKVEPFGNIRTDEATGESVVQEVREPMVDVFEEKDHTMVVAETPGISTEDVQIEARDDLLTIRAEKGDTKYYKEVLLPRAYPREKMAISCNNGILKIKCID
jgi:HSP20 family protein